MKKINIYSAICISLALSLTACNQWFDIKPTDRITEEMMFEDLQGFEKALTGVYMEMNDPDAYGRSLSTEMVDIFSQYYYVNTNKYLPYINFDYAHVNLKAAIESTWNKTYSLINNCNVIIEHVDQAPDFLPQQNAAIIKGEALGLRAMMHLDMLRLFGPIYSEETATETAIPYVTVSDQSVQAISSAKQVLDRILADLDAAAALLKDHDPIRTEGVLFSADATRGNSLRYRQYRLNYYAVEALRVRALLWSKQNERALEAVTALLGEVEAKKVFPFTSASQITSTSNPNRLFTTEVIFGLYNSNREKDVFDYNFNPTLTDASQYLLKAGGSYASGRLSGMYDDTNDYRYKIWGTTTLDGKEIVYTDKFKKNDNSNYNTMMPLIRITEMYLVLAELTPDLDQANEVLQKIRAARNCTALTATEANRNTLIQDEFRREVIGEGQMFFFYKRRAVTKLPNGTSTSKTSTRTMSLTAYVLPLPDSETAMRIE